MHIQQKKKNKPPKMPLSKFLLKIFVAELAAEKKLSPVIPARPIV
jgi:hypothetical protein